MQTIVEPDYHSVASQLTNASISIVCRVVDTQVATKFDLVNLQLYGLNRLKTILCAAARV